MSHSHVRVRVSPSPAKRNYWAEAAIVVVILALYLYYVQSRLWPDPVENTHETATGKVLETRLAVTGTVESRYGGGILYRIEAHVTYPLHGHQQDRWMPASESTADRNYLTFRMVKQTGTCTVYWAPRHEDNPKCILQ